MAFRTFPIDLFSRLVDMKMLRLDCLNMKSAVCAFFESAKTLYEYWMCFLYDVFFVLGSLEI